MTRPVVTTRRADEDIAAAVEHYAGEGAIDAALDLIDAFADATRILVEHPSIGSPALAVATGIAELRSFALARFPYALVYTDDADAVRVHRVLHTSRDIPAEL